MPFITPLLLVISFILWLRLMNEDVARSKIEIVLSILFVFLAPYAFTRILLTSGLATRKINLANTK